MPLLSKRRRLCIAYDNEEDCYYVESKSDHGFYHEVDKLTGTWRCNCHDFVLNKMFTKPCRHIILVIWYKQYQPHLIDTFIGYIPMLSN